MAKDSSDNAYGPEHSPVDLAAIPSVWTAGLPDEAAFTDAQRSSASPLSDRRGGAEPNNIGPKS